jgi:arylsulfatase A-like enzyme
MRRQFHHVIDIVPTILEAAGIPANGFGRRSAVARHCASPASVNPAWLRLAKQRRQISTPPHR